jgi:hypothetical protein
VILITTSKGMEGKPRLAYDGYAGAQQAINLPRVMNGAEYGAWRCQRLTTPAVHDVYPVPRRGFDRLHC